MAKSKVKPREQPAALGKLFFLFVFIRIGGQTSLVRRGG
jgi:hypothetical protein